MTQTASISLRTLGNSDLELTPIGLGTWAIGGGNWSNAWGPQDDADSIAAIHRAIDLGANWIDTAAVYGLGHSEEMVGRAVKSLKRKPYIFTKCSLRWGSDRAVYNSLKADSIAEEVEGSLKRLGVDVIDLYQIHWPKPEEDVEEGWETLARLQEVGKVRWIGVSNFSVDQMKRAMKIAPITSLQPPYSMLRRKIEADILPFAQANGIGVINYSPMLSGMLTGKMTAERAANLAPDDWRRGNKEFNQPRLAQNLRLVELLREIGNGHGVTPGVVAIAWVLHNPAITGAIVGGRSAQQVDETAAALTFRLSEDEFTRIVDFLATMEP
ncbi:MAG TPA: aldo/keto reductase [Terracidiphilus sp.]|nr:aldo/keto reductase [Terracidiphilus sp.]